MKSRLLSQRSRRLSVPALILGAVSFPAFVVGAAAAMMARSLVPELVRYMRIKSM